MSQARKAAQNNLTCMVRIHCRAKNVKSIMNVVNALEVIPKF